MGFELDRELRGNGTPGGNQGLRCAHRRRSRRDGVDGGRVRHRSALQGQGGLGAQHHVPASRASCTASRSRRSSASAARRACCSGMLSVKRTSKRDQVLKGLMNEAYHRALMAFPDEDVVVGSRFVTADGLEAFKQLDEIIPRPGHRAVGEERAWGRRLAKRFGVDSSYDEQSVRRQDQRPERLPRPRVAQAREGQARGRRAVRRRSTRRRPARSSSTAGSWPRTSSSWAPDQARRARGYGRPMGEFADVVMARRMTRAFRPDPVPDGTLERLVDAGQPGAPSAGKTQGWHFVVLEGDQTARSGTSPCRRAAAGRSGGRACSTRR